MKRLLSTILLIGFLASSINAARDEKFFKKASKIVWKMDLPAFNANTQIPDSSLYNNESAVVIAAYDYVDVKREQQTNISKYTTTGRAYTNAIEAKMLSRIMIKLNDSKAVEEFSEFEIDAKDKSSIMSYDYQYSNSAFGARIHKPDGTVSDVDCSEAYTVTAGKGRKEEDVEHKIAIPGLEQGDVLEYFYYDEVWLDELDLDPMKFIFARSYPMMRYDIECRIDPALTVEYRNLNGAPLLMGATDKEGNRLLNVTTINLEKFESGKWQTPARQIPFIKMRVLNNTSTMTYRPQSARRGGVFCSLPPKYYYDDISYILHDLELPTKITSKAVKIVKKYAEANPQLTQRQLIDAAWLATIYAGLVDEDSHSTIALSIYFADVLKKLKVQENAGIGVVCSRDNVPVTQILHWREPEYMNIVGDSCYILSGDYCFVPGEFLGGYEGEQAAVLWGDRKEFLQTDATFVQLPVSRANQNTIRSDLNVSLNPDDNTIMDISRKVTLEGSTKELASEFIDTNRYLRRVEDFLGITGKDRFKIEDDSVSIKERQDKLFAEEAKLVLGTEPRTIHSYHISEIGATPDEPKVVYEMTCDVDGLVKKAGNDLVISLGHLTGEQYEITGSERDRHYDVVRNTPSQYRHSITFEIPEGYTVNEASLESVNKNVANECGAFYAQARVQDNKLVIQVNERYLHYVVPIERWPKFLELNDASLAFSNTSIILNRTN